MHDAFHRAAIAVALLLVGCPTEKDIGAKPDDSGASSDLEGSGTETASSDSGSGSESGEPAPGEPVDCSTISADDEPVAGGPLGALGFPPHCSPRESGAATHICCSDDPAAVGGHLPDYQGKSIPDGTTPFFSGGNNAIGTWGVCVATELLPAGSGLLEPQAPNCPIPCNPTWEAGDIASVCGGNRSCCQTQALEPEDCIFDAELELWRPVTGDDIGESTDWAGSRHATHQDPGGNGCSIFAGGEGPANESWVDCIGWLAVANQRGFCMALETGQICPHDPSTGFLDACTQINMGLIPPPP